MLGHTCSLPCLANIRCVCTGTPTCGSPSTAFGSVCLLPCRSQQSNSQHPLSSKPPYSLSHLASPVFCFLKMIFLCVVLAGYRVILLPHPPHALGPQACTTPPGLPIPFNDIAASHLQTLIQIFRVLGKHAPSRPDSLKWSCVSEKQDSLFLVFSTLTFFPPVPGWG